jgi:hypothetical protein
MSQVLWPSPVPRCPVGKKAQAPANPCGEYFPPAFFCPSGKNLIGCGSFLARVLLPIGKLLGTRSKLRDWPLGIMAERQVSEEQKDRAKVSRPWWLAMRKGAESELDVHRAEDGSDLSGGVCSTMTQARGPAGGGVEC